MKVVLLSHTPEPEKIVAAAAKLCYDKDGDVEKLMDNLTPDRVEKFVDHLAQIGHASPFCHVTFTFGIEGVSRALTHQLVRHHIGAVFDQRSQRYCNEGDFEYVVPESIESEDVNYTTYIQAMASAKQAYKALVDAGVPKEDARMVLPNACVSSLVCTMNVQELYHVANLRMCSRAQWEIKELVTRMIVLCKEVSPILFHYAGPSCIKGYCPEGSMSCGKVPTLEKLLDAYHHVNFLSGTH